MAPALISQPVLPANPAANDNGHIDALLDELRARTDTLPIAPGQQVKVDYASIMDLRGVVSALIVAVRYDRKRYSA